MAIDPTGLNDQLKSLIKQSEQGYNEVDSVDEPSQQPKKQGQYPKDTVAASASMGDQSPGGEFIDPDAQQTGASGEQQQFVDPDAEQAPEVSQQSDKVGPFGVAGEGVQQGVLEAGQGIKQAALSTGEKLGLTPAGRAAEYTREVEEQRAARRVSMAKRFPNAKGQYSFGKMVGGTLPYAAVPGGRAASLGKRIISGSLAGAGIGASQFVPEGRSRATNAMVGGTIGAAAPAVLGGARAIAKKVVPTKQQAAQTVQQTLTPAEQAAGAKAAESARRIGTQLTPGEAAKSASMKGIEGRIPVTPKTQTKVAEVVAKRDVALKATAEKVSKKLPTEVKQRYTKEIQQIKLNDGQAHPTMEQVYNKSFATVEKRTRFLKEVRDSGGNVKQARDLLGVMSKIQKSPLTKLVRKDPSMKSVQFGKGPAAMLTEKTMLMLKGRYNKQLLELALDPKWESTVKSVMKAKGMPNKMERLGTALAKIAAKTAAPRAKMNTVEATKSD